MLAITKEGTVHKAESFDIIEVTSVDSVCSLIATNYLYKGQHSMQAIAELFINNDKLILTHIDLLEKPKEAIVIDGKNMPDTLEKISQQEDDFYIVCDIVKTVCGKFTVYLLPIEKHGLFKNRKMAALRNYIINQLYKD